MPQDFTFCRMSLGGGMGQATPAAESLAAKASRRVVSWKATGSEARSGWAAVDCAGTGWAWGEMAMARLARMGRSGFMASLDALLHDTPGFG